MFDDIAQRSREPEVMDAPSLDVARHRRALAGIARLNVLSRAAGSLWRPIAELPNGDSLRIVDVATGSGDVPLALWRRARREGRRVEICGVDVSPTAVQYARDRAAEAKAPVRFEVLDALRDDLPDGFDVVCCSLFLHQLDGSDVVLLLRKMKAARRMVLASDLVRSRRGLWLAQVATRLFTASDVARIDGPRSVKAAFTPGELQGLVREAGMGGAELKKSWPCRMLLVWKR